jgi:hypothetical protein
LEVTRNNKGGIAIRIKSLNARTLREALDMAMDVYDVEFEGDGILRYIHKRRDDSDVYYFANLSQTEINTPVRIRGHIKPQSWNKNQRQDSYDITRINLTIKPLKSVFILGSN